MTEKQIPRFNIFVYPDSTALGMTTFDVLVLDVAPDRILARYMRTTVSLNI